MSDGGTAQVVSGEIDQRTFRDVLGHYPTGVVVVTALAGDGKPLGMVVGTFSSVSLDPPLVSFMPTIGSETYAALRDADAYCINVLAHDQRIACRTLSARDPDKFDRVAWTPSKHGLPQIDGSVAYIHCRPHQQIEAGDHYIALCDVFDVEVARPVTPLLFFQGGYGGFSPAGMAAHVDSSLISAVRVAEVARPQLDRLAGRFGCSVAALIQVDDHDQTIGASAYGGSVPMDERLGVRIPLIPPLGEVAVAWSPGQAREWLARIYPQDPAVIDGYRARLAAVRESGYGVARVPEGEWPGYDRLGEALREYGSGQLTPARDRAVRAEFTAGARFFDSSVGEDETSVDLASVVVPVFDPTAGEPANSGLVLRLGNLPHGVTGRQVREWVDALKDAAAEVSAALAGTARRDLDRYVSSGLRQHA